MTTVPSAKAPGPAGRRVAVFGGGPAGLTVAHELIERGFEVDLFERHDVLGGKVRSYTHPGTGTEGRADLPGNMGGHFFLSFYPNLGDTMARIPTGSGRSVLDNLTTGPTGLSSTWVWGNAAARIPLPSEAGFPGNFTPAALLTLASESLKMLRMFTPTDVLVLGSKGVALTTSGERRHWDHLEHLALGDYLHADRLSAEASKIANMPGPFGFANAEGASARASSQFLSIMLNPLIGRPGRYFKDSVALLDGPENEAWIDPWATHLESLGTRFHLGHTVTGFTCADDRITSAVVRDETGHESRVEADWYVLAVPPDKAALLMTDRLVAADPALGRIERLQTLKMFSVQILLNHKVPELGTLFASSSAPWQTGNEVLTAAWSKDFGEHYGDGEAVEFVSIQLDDASWRHLPGMLYGKPAKDCTRAEIINEVLAQLRHYLPDGERLFAASAVHSVYLSPGLVGGETAPLSIDEPLFTAAASSWNDQPEPVTQIPNFFLAGSYTRNTIAADTMDGANESGKRAANGVLAAAGVGAIPVAIAPLREPRYLKPFKAMDDILYGLGLPNVFDIVAPTPSRRRSRESSRTRPTDRASEAVFHEAGSNRP